MMMKSIFLLPLLAALCVVAVRLDRRESHVLTSTLSSTERDATMDMQTMHHQLNSLNHVQVALETGSTASETRKRRKRRGGNCAPKGAACEFEGVNGICTARAGALACVTKCTADGQDCVDYAAGAGYKGTCKANKCAKPVVVQVVQEEVPQGTEDLQRCLTERVEMDPKQVFAVISAGSPWNEQHFSYVRVLVLEKSPSVTVVCALRWSDPTPTDKPFTTPPPTLSKTIDFTTSVRSRWTNYHTCPALNERYKIKPVLKDDIICRELPTEQWTSLLTGTGPEFCKDELCLTPTNAKGPLITGTFRDVKFLIKPNDPARLDPHNEMIDFTTWRPLTQALVDPEVSSALSAALGKAVTMESIRKVYRSALPTQKSPDGLSVLADAFVMTHVLISLGVPREHIALFADVTDAELAKFPVIAYGAKGSVAATPNTPIRPDFRGTAARTDVYLALLAGDSAALETACRKANRLNELQGGVGQFACDDRHAAARATRDSTVLVLHSGHGVSGGELIFPQQSDHLQLVFKKELLEALNARAAASRAVGYLVNACYSGSLFANSFSQMSPNLFAVSAQCTCSEAKTNGRYLVTVQTASLFMSSVAEVLMGADLDMSWNELIAALMKRAALDKGKGAELLRDLMPMTWARDRDSALLNSKVSALLPAMSKTAFECRQRAVKSFCKWNAKVAGWDDHANEFHPEVARFMRLARLADLPSPVVAQLDYYNAVLHITKYGRNEGECDNLA